MKHRIHFMVLITLSVLIIFTTVHAANKSFGITPTLNNGKKWRIGYYEAGEYINYQQVFIGVVNQLMEIGWLEKTTIPPQEGSQTKDLWQWLSQNVKSKYIEFPADGHYTANWDNKIRETTTNKIIQRVNAQKDIDLIIVMGTKSGLDLANDRHKTPIIVLSASDAVGSGIVKSIEDSGYDHVLARIDPFRYERQVRIFHDIIGFQKLGMIYRDDASGKSIAAYDKVKMVADERGFEIVSCLLKPDIELAEETDTIKSCIQEIGKKADAYYVTELKGINADTLPDLVNLINSLKIPTFSQNGSKEVKYGILMSISQAGYKYLGRFAAETIAKIFNGAKPRELDQVFEDPPTIAINLKTAEIIGYDPPVDVLGAADEIYQEIYTTEDIEK